MGSAVAGAIPYLREPAQARRHGNQGAGLIQNTDGSEDPDAMTPEQKKANLRLALILATVAAVFMLGIFAKMAFLGG